MKLNARQVETAKPKDKPYKLADGGGMYLEVFPNGTKSWGRTGKISTRSLVTRRISARLSTPPMPSSR